MAASGIEQAVGEINRRWDEAFNAGDAAGVASLYAEDARLLTPTRTIATGRREIEAYWRQLMEHGWRGHAWEPLEFSGEGHTVWQVGRWSATKDGSEHQGNLIAIYGGDAGSLLIRHHIWN